MLLESAEPPNDASGFQWKPHRRLHCGQTNNTVPSPSDERLQVRRVAGSVRQLVPIGDRDRIGQ